MEITPYGDQAIIINFGDSIDYDSHDMIMHYRDRVKRMSAVDYVIPAYSSLTIVYNKEFINQKQLIEEIERLSMSNSLKTASESIEIPVCYEDSFALDIKEVEIECQLDKKEIIQLHTSRDFLVFMMGFIPGFPYMGKLPEQLQVRRKDRVQQSVPAGSVGLAGIQTGIYPDQSPGGWKIIGRTPLQLFNSSKKEPFLLKAGDRVKFREISTEEFESIAKRQKSKE